MKNISMQNINLKSSLDRFIVVETDTGLRIDRNLKSSLDRFIGFLNR